MILHSTSHPVMEYTGREVDTPGLRHYIGLFDPKSGKVEVIEAKKMLVRAAARSQQLGETKEKQVRPALLFLPHWTSALTATRRRISS